jgi:hypothetical protein
MYQLHHGWTFGRLGLLTIIARIEHLHELAWLFLQLQTPQFARLASHEFLGCQIITVVPTAASGKVFHSRKVQKNNCLRGPRFGAQDGPSPDPAPA